MTQLKFCGMTREQDIATAVDVGADALGFVLWPRSPRHVDFDRLESLIALLPANVLAVGVFVRPTRKEIATAVDVGVRVVQLHGVDDNWSNDSSCEVWVAASLIAGEMQPNVRPERIVLLDAHDPEQHGGTGQTIDWDHASRIAAMRRVILAGGLTPTNVADAIRRVRPFGVDVASGIEDSPGVKNAGAMRAFAAAVRQADQ
jgi:phosphoribosylanthranilate isomerase